MKMNKLFAGVLMISSLYGSITFANDLTLSYSKEIAENAINYALKKGLNVSVAIVNSEGNLVLFQRTDGAYMGSIDAAIDKAKSSSAFQRPTSAFVEGAKTKVGLIGMKEVVAVEGGMPIIIKGKFFGAIGISGAKALEDEEIALAAVKVLEKK